MRLHRVRLCVVKYRAVGIDIYSYEVCQVWSEYFIYPRIVE